MTQDASRSNTPPTAWTPEPWDATLNGTFHHQGLYIGEVEDPENPKPGYASDRDVANARRLVECVNALVGVPQPSAVPLALAALKQVVAALRKDLRTRLAENTLSPELMQTLNDAESVLARLQNSPE